MKALLPLCTFLLLSCESNKKPAAPQPGNATNTRASEDSDATEDEIIELVRDSMVAGFADHDIEGYLEIWSDEARLVGGRGPAAAPTDVVLSRKQIEATKRLRFAGKPTGLLVSPVDPKVVVSGDEAVLTWRIKTEQPDFVEVVDEIYKLRKTGRGWRVYENRYWIVKAGGADAPTLYDAEYWKAKDLAVEAARSAGDKRAESNALAAAGRWPEAHAILVELTSASEELELWDLRMSLALASGLASDAQRAACKCKSLGPEHVLPAWAESLRCQE